MSPESIEKTKQQIRGLVSEIAQLSQSDLDEAEFWPAFLQRTVQALAAVGGAIWLVRPWLRLAYQINISELLLEYGSVEAEGHFRLLDRIIATNEGHLVPPLLRRSRGNPTRQLLVLGPLRRGGRAQGIVEIFQRADTMPATQRGYLQFLKQMCDLGSDFLGRKG